MQSSTPQAQRSPWESQADRPTLLKAVRPNDGHQPPTRKRNPLACEWCYKKKIKCEVEGSNTACVQCIRRNLRCKFTTRKEKREALKRAQYVKALEDRLRRTETLLRAAGVLDDAAVNQEELDIDEDEMLESGSDFGSEDEETFLSPDMSRNRHGEPQNCSLSPNTPAKRASSERSRPGSSSGNSDLQHVSVFRSDHRDESRYYGRASSLSILSREGIEWIKARTGDTKFLNFISSQSSHDYPWDYWRADVFHDLFSSQVYKPLPPRAEVFSLVKNFFQTSNRLFPLYDETSFMRLVEWQYTQQTCNDAAWWASINIILALAYEYRTSDNMKPERNREKAWLYFKNAMSVFPELALRRTDLLSLQALLALAFFLRGNSGSQTAMPIVTAAMRACHRLGLHRDVHRPRLPWRDLEQRRRVFWIAYILDQSTCVRVGSSPAQSVDDFDVDLPEAEHNTTLFFRQLCSLNVIKSRIYGRLYSAKGLQKTPADVCQVVKELHAELEEWRNANPIDNTNLKQVNGDNFLSGFASVGLQLVYYNCLIMIHRMPLVLGHYARYLGNTTQIHFDLRWFADQSHVSSSVCVQAARETLRLVNNMPWGDIAWLWSMLYYVFLAVMTLFVNILRDSHHPKAKDDLQSLNVAATFFATLIPNDWPCYHAKFMARMCANFERIARVVIEREDKAVKTRAGGDKPSRSLSKGQTASTGPSQQIHQTSQHTSSSAPGLGVEHFPPVNSSSYVVPGGPSTSTSSPTATTTTTNLSNNTLPPDFAPYTAASNNNNNNAPTTSHLDTIFPTTTMTNDITSTTPWPDFWQIPLTADWEFGNQFLSGVLSYNYNLQPSADGVGGGGVSEQQPFLSTTAMPAAAVPPPGYFFGNADPNLAQAHGQGQGQGQSAPMWTDGFLNSMV